MKFRCPYCHNIFAAQAGSFCPSCSKAMVVPSKFRQSADTKHTERSRLSPELRQKKRNLEKGSLSGAATWAQATKSPRYIAALVILFVVIGVALTQQATRHTTEKVRRSNPVQHAAEDLTTLRTALELFHKDCGRYPSTRESLVALLRHPGARNWDGPYIKNLIPDPWKQSYRYSLTKGVMRLTSDGPDGVAGTADDIVAPSLDMELVYPTNQAEAADQTGSTVP